MFLMGQRTQKYCQHFFVARISLKRIRNKKYLKRNRFGVDDFIAFFQEQVGIDSIIVLCGFVMTTD